MPLELKAELPENLQDLHLTGPEVDALFFHHSDGQVNTTTEVDAANGLIVTKAEIAEGEEQPDIAAIVKATEKDLGVVFERIEG